jgi:hypothetical protein
VNSSPTARILAKQDASGFEFRCEHPESEPGARRVRVSEAGRQQGERRVPSARQLQGAPSHTHSLADSVGAHGESARIERISPT